MRVSTRQVFANGIDAMQRQRTALMRTQNQLSTNQRMLSPSDDPAGAVKALRLHQRTAAVSQYDRNADQAAMRLGQESTALSTMTDALQRVRELTLRAINGTQTNASREAMAQELRQIQKGLVNAANTRDAAGDYIFAGFRTDNQPFVLGASGQVQYQGDSGERRIEIAAGTKIKVADSGRTFMTLPEGNGVFTVTPAATNTGDGTVDEAEVFDASSLTGHSYTLSMVAPVLPSTAMTYQVMDDTTSTVVATGTYQAGQAIEAGGMRVVLKGSPEPTDSFAIEPADNTSLFAIVDDLATALETPANDAAARAQLSHHTRMALMNVDQASSRVLSMRTAIGARLNTLEQQQNVNADKTLRLKTTLSSVEGLDYAKAISRFTMQRTALQVAQQTYSQVARLSLFNWLR